MKLLNTSLVPLAFDLVCVCVRVGVGACMHVCLCECCYDEGVCDGTWLDRPGHSLVGLPAAEIRSHLDCCCAAD